MNMKISSFFACLLLAGCMSGCKPSPSSGPEPVETLTLRLAVNDIYCKDSACVCVHDVAARAYAGIIARMKADHQIDLQLVYFEEPYELVKKIVAREVDGAICKPWLVLKEENAAEYTRVADILDINENQWLKGIFVVKADSSFQSLADLNGKTLVLGDADGYEKSVAARNLLEARKIKPGKMYTKAACIENLGELLDGKADCAVISDYALTADCAVDFAKPEDFRTLAETAPIPLTSVMLDTAKVSSADIARVKRALLAISGEELKDTFLSTGFVEPAPFKPHLSQ